MTKGLVYYSDCRGDRRILQAVRDQIQRAAPGLPIASVTLGPVDWTYPRPLDSWQEFLALERGYGTMFLQILTGLELLETDVVCFVEHDVLYHPSHFAFTPPRADVFYYNQHTWKVDAQSGRALHYLCSQTSGLCADRQLLLAHYRLRLAAIARDGYQRHMGFEPGTNRWARALDGHHAETWMSAVPNIDIRHGHNLTPSRWSRDRFRNKNSCLGWTESDGVPGWGQTAGVFDQFLERVSAGEVVA